MCSATKKANRKSLHRVRDIAIVTFKKFKFEIKTYFLISSLVHHQTEKIQCRQVLQHFAECTNSSFGHSSNFYLDSFLPNEIAHNSLSF